MYIRDVIDHLETLAPPMFQETYDNAKLLVGDENWKVKGVLVCLDSIEGVVDEAIEKGCNLIVAHHPIIFSGLKSLTGKNYIERTIIKAIKNDIAIYAIHTNLDHMHNGVNYRLGQAIGLTNMSILSPKTDLLLKLSLYVPIAHLDAVRKALFSEGAGHIGAYKNCSFSSEGEGTFMATEGTNPFIGSIGETHTEKEVKLEVVLTREKQLKIIEAMKNAHPYEEVAFELVAIENSHQQIGSGMIGEISSTNDLDFLTQLKTKLNVGCVKYTNLLNKPITKVAICGGSGSFLLSDAIRSGADIFITSDFKYHQFFDADNKIIVADIGHFESEQTTIQLIADWINEKFCKFAVHLTEVNTNPVNYL